MIFRQMFGMTAARGFYALVNAYLFIVLARELGPGVFGFLAAFVAFYAIFFTVLGMNSPTFISREYALKNYANARGSLRMNRYLLGGGLVAALGPVYWLTEGTAMALAVGTAAFAAFMDQLSAARLSVAYARHTVYGPLLSTWVRACSNAALFSVLLFGAGVDPLLCYAVSRSVSEGLGYAITVVSVRLSFSEDPVGVPEVFRRQIPMALTSATAALRTADPLVLTAVAGPAATGVYAAAARLLAPFSLLAAAISPILIPQAARADSARIRKSVDITYGATLGLTGLTLLLLPFNEEIVVLIFGAEYAGGGIVLSWVLLRVGTSTVWPVLAGIFQSRNMDRFVALNSVAMSFLVLCGVGVGAWVGGAAGAAAGYSLVALVGYSALWAGGRRRLNEL